MNTAINTSASNTVAAMVTKNSRRHFQRDFKKSLIKEIETKMASIKEVAEREHIAPAMIYKWRGLASMKKGFSKEQKNLILLIMQQV